MTSVPQISLRYDTFPAGYINDVHGWAFDEATIRTSAGSLLTLDLDFGSRCSLNCPFCFRKDNSVDSTGRELQSVDIVRIAEEAHALGLRSVKFLGAGEPLENPGILEFLDVLAQLNVIPIIFTKTGVIGNDSVVSELFAYRGIHTGRQLADELHRLGASLVVGFNAFDQDVQRRMTGDGAGFVARRNRTLEVLADAGFRDHNPTRLAVGVNPVTRLNIGEAYAIYEWARLRNLYPIVTPTMVSGRARGNAWKAMTPTPQDLADLYTQIYLFNLQRGITTRERLLHEGISAYAGGHPCNQVGAGLYVTLHGVVLSCPGSEESIEGNVWDNRLEDLWPSSRNYARRGTYNCRCIAKDGKSIPTGLYERVLRDVTSDAVR